MAAYPNNSSLAAYRSVAAHSGVAAADPHRLIVMLMDGALKRIGAARGAMEQAIAMPATTSSTARWKSCRSCGPA